jgi:hypothetical protein
MFVRVKKIGGYEYLYLVENAREGGRHVQRVIKALGRRDGFCQLSRQQVSFSEPLPFIRCRFRDGGGDEVSGVHLERRS